MNLDGRNLARGAQGNDVAALQDELQRLGLELTEDELAARIMGESTENAVRDFQRHRELPVTGVVDHVTARAMTAALEGGVKLPARLQITGRIATTDGRPVPYALVRAVDRDLRSEQPLGEVNADEGGRYRLIYSSAAFRRAEKRSADLVVRALDHRSGQALGESAVLFNAPPSASVDVAVPPAAADGRRSELELLLDAVVPALDGAALPDLGPADIDFLAGEARADRARIQLASTSARLARETGIWMEAFYAWGRAGLPDAVGELVALADDALLDAVARAAAERIVPAWPAARPAELLHLIDALRLRLGRLVERELRGALRGAGLEAPLAGFTIAARDLDRSAGGLGRAVTDRAGRFRFRIASTAAVRRVRLEVLDGAGAALATHDVQLGPGRSEPVELVLPAEHAPGGAATGIEDLAGRFELPVSRELIAALAGRGVHTLAELRRAGGVARLDGLPADPSARLLDAHAQLSLLTDDPAEAQALVARGFDGVAAVGRRSRTAFVRDAGGQLGEARAVQLHAAARAQADTLAGIAASVRADAANRYPAAQKGPFQDSVSPGGGGMGAAALACSCDDCQAATSPLAYLADLLDYATENLEDDGAPLTLSWLTGRLRQPLADLPAACAEVDRRVRQVRVCIEVLRRHARAGGLTVPADRLQSYLAAAYRALLHQSGASYDELRLARGAPAEQRARLAERLGVALGPAPDALDRLLLDLTAAPGDGAASEARLEELFGLVDSDRDPFCHGPLRGDDGGQLLRWTFRGLEWGRATDADGVLHLSLRQQGAAVTVEVYRDAARAPEHLVASGSRQGGVGTVSLTQRNQSGLSGEVRIDHDQDTSSLSIAAVPHLLAWRLGFLRRTWGEVDWPVDDYSAEAPARLPILDPDLAGVDDLRRPEPGQPAHDIWRVRRLWVDQRAAALAALGPDLDALLAAALAPVTYTPLVGAPVAAAAWTGAVQPGDLDALHRALLEGPDSEAAAATVAAELRLTAQSFGRLMELRRKHQLAATSASAPLLPDEWVELVDILVAAGKAALGPHWIAEEEAAGVALGPDQFWIALAEPVAGAWPPVRAAGHPWIDPRARGLVELPDVTAGAAARALWQARDAAADQLDDELDGARRTGGLDAALLHAVGHPGPGDALPPPVADLESLYDRAVGADAAEADQAAAAIDAHLFMAVDAFVRLMDVRVKAADADPALQPGEEDWREVLAILAGAARRKRLYPAWLAEEAAAGLDAEYWRARKARLPRWRSSAAARALWQRELAARSAPPAVDPDRLIWSDLRAAPAAAAARSLWQARTAWIAARAAALEALPETAAGLDDMIASSLGVPASIIDELVADEEQGSDIGGRLGQQSLGRAELTRLVGVRRLLAQGAPVLAEEWRDARAILVQVDKRRRFGAWRREERAAGVTVNPDAFAVSTPDGLALPAWRGSWRERRAFQDLLQSRIDQDRAAAQALADAVSQVEADTLPLLREALLVALPGGGDLAARSRWVIDNLLIDAEMGGCAMTTRVSQAIETMQTLIHSTASNLLRETHPDLAVVDEQFHARWQWLGSYATWRAAMFVFLYPENILHPSFRPPAHTSPAMRELGEAAGDPNLTPASACEAAARHATYLRDVCNLDVVATCLGETRQRSTGCDGGAAGEDGTRPLFYMVARCATSSALYWSLHDPDDPSPWAQTFWQRIEELDEVQVGSVLGLAPYEQSDSVRHLVLVFTLAERSDVVALARYDLDARAWVDEVIELELPDKGRVAGQHMLVAQCSHDSVPPMLIIRRIHEQVPDAHPRIWARALSTDLAAWEGKDASGEDDPSAGTWDAYQISGWITTGPLTAVVRMPVDHEWPTATIDTLIFVHGGQLTRVGVDDLSVSGTQDVPHPGTPVGAVAGTNGTGVWLGVFLRSVSYGQPLASLVWVDMSEQDAKVHWHLPGVEAVAPHFGEMALPRPGGDAYHHFVYRIGDGGWWPSAQYLVRFEGLIHQPGLVGSHPVAPLGLSSGAGHVFVLSEHLDTAQLQEKRAAIADAFADNASVESCAATLVCLEEAFYFAPVLIALKLHRRGFYDSALAWLRTVYDYSAPDPDQRKIYHGLVAEESISLAHAYDRDESWLLDPLDPHLVAESRRGAYTRFTLLSIIQCFLDWADGEFTLDTAESVARARTLYRTALGLLDSPDLAARRGRCDEVIGSLKVEIASSGLAGTLVPLGPLLDHALSLTSHADLLADAVGAASAALAGPGAPAERALRARDAIDERVARIPAAAPTLDQVLVAERAAAADTMSALLTHPAATAMARRGSALAERAAANHLSRVPTRPGSSPGKLGVGPLLRVPGLFGLPKVFSFCVPKNPLLLALRLRAETSLFKIRTCRNFAGMRRDLEPYAAATDTVTGLPSLGVGDQLVLPGVARLAPTTYRYQTLIERAKQLVALAQQAEAAFLGAVERAEAERYNLLKARQDAELARAGTRLQVLRVKEARDEIDLAELQRERAEIERDQYAEWLEAGISQLEELTIAMLVGAGATQLAAAAAASGTLDPAKALELTAEQLRTAATIASHYAEFERRAEEWAFRKALAEHDMLIGGQQVRIARDHLEVVEQERAIAELQAEHAQEGLDFLSNKFTSAELYEWMSGVLEGIYRRFLRQATSIAQLAAGQLAFERQQMPPPVIQADYWEPPQDFGAGDGMGDRPDRRGLTGSMRLLQDIHQLDQYAFETDQRKLQLTRTISLARTAPLELARMRETGVLLFSTPMDLFDRDFPGHYLRLIKRVRTSVVALVPPAEGIRATLSASGLSRAVIGAGGSFQTVVVRTPPQSVALSSPSGATGLFELGAAQEQAMLLPFEGMGVDASWELRMPKAANQFDFATIADVLLTIEYTALDDSLYRQQVVAELDSRWRAERAFRLRHDFADQWFDLHHPDESATPMRVQLRTSRADFPPNVDELRVSHVALYLAGAPGADGEPIDWPDVSLTLSEEGAAGPLGGTAGPVDGLISTRRAMGASWLAMIGRRPLGTWELSLPDTQAVRRLFREERVADILLVVSYAGSTPPWPS